MKKIYEIPLSVVVMMNTGSLLTGASTQELDVNADGEKVTDVEDLLSRGFFGNLWADDELDDDECDTW